MTRPLLLSVLLLAAGCASPAPPSNAPPPVQPAPPVSGAAECSNAALAQFVGQKIGQELGARMLRTSGARVIRWVAPGMMVTMDFRPDRLTVNYDAQGLVTTINCG